MCDVTGSNGIDDEAIRNLDKAAITEGNDTEKPGLKELHTLKFSGATISDGSIPTLTKVAPNLEHLELIKCDGVGDFGVGHIIEKCPKLIYLDISKLPIVNYTFLDELKATHPELLIRRNVYHEDDFTKDNGLRVPRRIIQKKKAKKKKGKGKKKK